jgi:hypothetical protein
MRIRKLAVAIVWWGFALVFNSALGWCGTLPPESPLKAMVRTYNYAEAPGGVLAGGERVAAEIFRHAGIELVWTDCSISLKDLDKSAACETSTDLTVNILPETMASRFRLPHSIGVTIQQNASFVFYHRVQVLADHTGVSESTVLGPVLAHELGHLLLGEGVHSDKGAHSDKGIMMANLSANNFQEASKGNLLTFSAEQAQRMRARLLRHATLGGADHQLSNLRTLGPSKSSLNTAVFGYNDVAVPVGVPAQAEAECCLSSEQGSHSPAARIRLVRQDSQSEFSRAMPERMRSA